jgi:hypothetical protein
VSTHDTGQLWPRLSDFTHKGTFSILAMCQPLRAWTHWSVQKTLTCLGMRSLAQQMHWIENE